MLKGDADGERYKDEGVVQLYVNHYVEKDLCCSGSGFGMCLYNVSVRAGVGCR